MPGSENSIRKIHYVYVLESSKSKSLYIGYTVDLKNRLNQHNKGMNFSTKPFLPWHLIFFEAYLNKKDAIRREGYLKTSQGSHLLRRMLKDYFYNQKKK